MFVNRDPIVYAGGVNLCSYVGNNPMKGVDPSGLYFDPIDENAPDSAPKSDLQCTNRN